MSEEEKAPWLDMAAKVKTENEVSEPKYHGYHLFVNEKVRASAPTPSETDGFVNHLANAANAWSAMSEEEKATWYAMVAKVNNA